MIEEFFQLFKVPWEFYNKEKSYGVVIVTDPKATVPPGHLVILFGAETTAFDVENGCEVCSLTGSVLLEGRGLEFPVYKNVTAVRCPGSVLLKMKDGADPAGVACTRKRQTILRIGYDLFDEVAFLLSGGQPTVYAHIPTLEIHIGMLRRWILESGLPLVEIPPFPSGSTFIVCLTHDVDFADIRGHKFDRTVLGFIFRVLFPSHLRDFRSRISWFRLLKNWKALFSLPGVYLGLSRDFWFEFDRYSEIEREMASTFFFIPFKDDPGDTPNHRPPPYRAARYDVRDLEGPIKALMKRGHEIGLHGLDAWHDPRRGGEELRVIREITGAEEVGVRIHWLLFSENSPAVLQEAGFLYDSTLGYNDAIGYRCGTTQVFRLSPTSLFELPLHAMDTAMFYRKRMGLSESRALQLCRHLIDEMRTYGGVFTLNWHTRSLSPERNWDDFYIELLRILKTEKVWFASAKQVVDWFHKRRLTEFNEVNVSRERIRVKLKATDKHSSPPLLLRAYYPQAASKEKGDSVTCRPRWGEVPLSGETEISFPL